MASILFVACTALTFSSIYSANRVYKPHDREQYDLFAPDNNFMREDKRTENVDERRISENDHFAIISFISVVLVFILGTTATYVIAGRALKPITKLSRDIGTIDENNLFMQLEKPTVNDEVSRLSASFNRMIDRLEKACISQKNFSANAAHELKTPLAAMISSIEVCQLDENPTPQEYKQTLNDVLQNAERLSGLVNDLLAMNSDNTILRDKFDLQEMFGQIIHDNLQNDKNVRLDNQINGIALSGDKNLLYRAFFNLAYNAVKYNKQNGTVTFSAKKNTEEVIIKISDTGIGVPAGQLDKIFDPFYCVDKSRSRQLGGSGLGLSIVKAIIEKHGGNIHAESEINNGAVITVNLPL
jgi:signal transduction histidine kinase